MTVTISRLYDDYATASQAVRQLESAGIDKADISLVASNADNWYSGDQGKGARTSGRIDRDRDGVDDRAEGAAGRRRHRCDGGRRSRPAGRARPHGDPRHRTGGGGRLARRDGCRCRGGRRDGGIIGALSQSGIGEDEAHVYAEGIRRGGTLVTVRGVPEAEKARVEALLDRSAVNIRDRGMAYRKSGWSQFDPNAPVYTPDQVRKERDLYRRPAA